MTVGFFLMASLWFWWLNYAQFPPFSTLILAHITNTQVNEWQFLRVHCKEWSTSRRIHWHFTFHKYACTHAHTPWKNACDLVNWAHKRFSFNMHSTLLSSIQIPLNPSTRTHTHVCMVSNDTAAIHGECTPSRPPPSTANYVDIIYTGL